MKRSVLILIVCLLGSFAVRSENEDTKPLFGLRAGLDLEIPGKWHNQGGSVKMFRCGYGVNIGGVCNMYLAKGFYLEPGVSLFYQRYSYDDIYIDEDQTDKDPKIDKFGVRIPVMVGYDINLSEKSSISVYTGPEISYAFAGKYHFNKPELWGDLTTVSLFSTYRRFDLAWKVGIGLPIGRSVVGIDAAFGLTDLMKNPDISFRENRVTLSLTRFF